MYSRNAGRIGTYVAALLCRSPDRYYLIFHVKVFRIPERHLIHVSHFEARLSRSAAWSVVEFEFDRARGVLG